MQRSDLEVVEQVLVFLLFSFYVPYFLEVQWAAARKLILLLLGKIVGGWIFEVPFPSDL